MLEKRVPVKCETKQERNGSKGKKQIETKRNRSKRNETNRNETNDMASHCGQLSVFSNIRKSFSNIKK